ncbi:unnamed protein product [Triticum turgidum subsp. durum]|uniref:MSP domain-containing protein n=1 Tax=Triticum turgidum subsp. durum TaxID=4567 RepID=A0A9R0UW19_TRITD|nr:unnamed protein product [Triticum turgidum subsp. durum]
MAASSDLLDVDPPELQFPFELDKQISCPLKMINKTDRTVAFKVKTTSPKKYCVRPNNGVVRPRSTCEVAFFCFILMEMFQRVLCGPVTMQAQIVAPPDLQCKDKFLVQSVVVADRLSAKDITAQMFTKQGGNAVREVRMRVTYVMPTESSLEIAEESDGRQRILVPMQRIVDHGRSASGLSSGSVSLRSAELGTEVGSPTGPVVRTEELLKAAGHAAETRTYAGPDAQSLELSALITKLTKEKDSALEQNKKLRSELVSITVLSLKL